MRFDLKPSNNITQHSPIHTRHHQSNDPELLLIIDEISHTPQPQKLTYHVASVYQQIWIRSEINQYEYGLYYKRYSKNIEFLLTQGKSLWAAICVNIFDRTQDDKNILLLFINHLQLQLASVICLPCLLYAP